MGKKLYKIKDEGESNFIIIPSISKYSSRKEWETRCWNDLVKNGTSLQLFTTSHERHDIFMRMVVFERIKSGKSYREIGKELWVSPQTISSIMKFLQKNEYKSYREGNKEKRGKNRGLSISSRPLERRVRTKFGTRYVSY